MQTIASLAERLDMTAEEALEKLRYMFFEVDSIESGITDEQCDLLIDIDENPSIAEQTREAKLKEVEKARERTERLQAAARKAAATRKAKAPAKKKAAGKAKPKAKAKAKKSAEEEETPPEEAAIEAGEAPTEEIAPVAVAEEAAKAEGPVAEILPDEVVPKDAGAAPSVVKAREKKAVEAESKGPAILIGSAIDHEARKVEIVRADGTHLEAPDVDIAEEPVVAETEPTEEEEQGLLAEAERRQEEEDRRNARIAARPLAKPDPAVVAEVIRKAAERKARGEVREKVKGRKAPKPHQESGVSARGEAPAATRRTGKTARKRQKKAERARLAEDVLRRDAAAAVREYEAGGLGAPKRRKRKRTRGDEAVDASDTPSLEILEVEHNMTVEQFAERMDTPVNDLILELMDENILVTKNQALELSVMQHVALPRGFEVVAVIPEEEDIMKEEPDDPKDLKSRAPVVTVMGHVDHGKTTLLDKIRSANVVDSEAGGITQHIAAYDVDLPTGRVVFLDTPGHEAFTQMRARGAQATDIVVLVVAADDGVMPQTEEAIDHAKAAGVPIVVAVNKCDKPGAQPDRIRQELTRFDLVGEEWGGKTLMKNISALRGDGVSELMELLVLEAELLELKANPTKPARGVVIESEITRGLGPVAWVLVQSGTLRVGDEFLAGCSTGRVRSMHDSHNKTLGECGPATPVAVTGFDSPPDAGDQFVVVKDERVARAIAEKRAQVAKQKEGASVRRITLEDFHARMLAGEQKQLNIVLKADVQGSVDVMSSSLSQLGNEEVKTSIVHAGVGGINESDVLLASASNAVVLGFHVTANPRAQKLAEQEGVEIRSYRIIYEAIDAVRSALTGMLAPKMQEMVTGHAEVRQVFHSSALGNIAGCYQKDGEMTRNASARLLRDDVIVYEGKIGSLRRGKEDARSVAAGLECGIKLENFDDIRVGDVIEAYRIDQIAQTLS